MKTTFKKVFTYQILASKQKGVSSIYYLDYNITAKIKESPIKYSSLPCLKESSKAQHVTVLSY